MNTSYIRVLPGRRIVSPFIGQLVAVPHWYKASTRATPRTQG